MQQRQVVLQLNVTIRVILAGQSGQTGLSCWGFEVLNFSTAPPLLTYATDG